MKKKILIKASGITAPSWRGYNAGVGRSVSSQKLAHN